MTPEEQRSDDRYATLQAEYGRCKDEVRRLTADLAEREELNERLLADAKRLTSELQQVEAVRDAGIREAVAAEYGELQADNTRLRAVLINLIPMTGQGTITRAIIDTALAPQAVEAPREASGEAADEWRVCRKKPVVVHVRDAVPGEEVFTREGLTTAKDDDLVMRGVDGEVYPIGRDIFERTYDVVEPAAPREDAPAPVQTFAVGQRVRIDCRDSPGFGTVLKDWGDDSYSVQHDDYPNHMRYGWSVLATPAAPPATRDDAEWCREQARSCEGTCVELRDRHEAGSATYEYYRGRAKAYREVAAHLDAPTPREAPSLPAAKAELLRDLAKKVRHYNGTEEELADELELMARALLAGDSAPGGAK